MSTTTSTHPNVCPESTKRKLKMFIPPKVCAVDVARIRQLISEAPAAFCPKLSDQDILMLSPASMYHIDKDGTF